MSASRTAKPKGRAVFRGKVEHPRLDQAGAPTMTSLRLAVDVPAVFGRARPAVRVTVAKHTYRSTVAKYGSGYFLPLRRSNREAAGVAAGDVVRVVVELDEAPRVVRAPRDLAKALRTNAKAKARWDTLSFTHKREHADAIANAKKPETRARRIAACIAMLEN